LKLNKKQSSNIKDFIFESCANKVLEDIKDASSDVKCKVRDFFVKDVKQYHEDLAAWARSIGKDDTDEETIEETLTILTNELLLKANEIEELVANKPNIKKIKDVFRELSNCWLHKGAIAKMSYDKPRGYPGDYKLFEIIYDNKPLSEKKDIGYYCDKYFINNAYAQAARCRKNKMKNILQDLIENSKSPCLRLLNVACGPSREIRELLYDPVIATKRKIIFTGLDNDEESLEFSKLKLNSVPSNIELRFIKENVLNISKNKEYRDIIGKQDIIYILGLTEYLPDRVFKKLINFLFSILKEKGRLVITYKDKDIVLPSLPPDWFSDWAFIKRSKEDLINATKDLGDGKFTLNIEREGTGSIFFLILTKN